MIWTRNNWIDKNTDCTLWKTDTAKIWIASQRIRILIKCSVSEAESSQMQCWNDCCFGFKECHPLSISSFLSLTRCVRPWLQRLLTHLPNCSPYRWERFSVPQCPILILIYGVLFYPNALLHYFDLIFFSNINRCSFKMNQMAGCFPVESTW